MFCRNSNSRRVLLLGLLATTATAWTAKPAAVPAEKPKETPAERIERALDKIVDIDFDEDAWLSDALKFLDKQGIKAKFDEKALADANMALSTHLKFRVNGISLRSGLRWLLHELELKAIIRDDILLITTEDVADDLTEPRVYPVLDLLTNADIDATDITSYDFRRLKDLLANNVCPDSWFNTGGVGGIEPIPVAGSLLIAQTQEMHAEIAEVLAMLRRVRDQQFAGGKLKPLARRKLQPVMTLAEATPTAERALSVSKDFDLRNAPLPEAAAWIGKQWGIPVLLLGIENANDIKVSLKEKNCRLDTGLDRILMNLNLGWGSRDRVLLIRPKPIPQNEPEKKDEVLLIHTGNRGLEEVTVVRIYPISDLVTRPGGEDELIDGLLSTLKPDSWIATGGPGNIEYFVNAAALVVSQTEDVHDQLQDLLTQIRQVRDKQFPVLAEPQADDPKNPPLNRKIYIVAPLARPNQAGGGLFSVPDETPKQSQPKPPLAQFGGMRKNPLVAPVAGKPDTQPVDPTADLVRVIPQIIEPSSWKEAGGKGVIQALPGRLVVLQTSRVHYKIARFLEELKYSAPEQRRDIGAKG